MNQQQINIVVEENPLVPELIKTTLKHYPVGFSFPNEAYPGYLDLRAVIASKIDQLIAGKLPESYYRLVEMLIKEFDTSRVITEIERQFPNYAFTIELLKKELKEVTLVYNLKLKLSLLAKCYTVFHEEMIIHNSISINSVGFAPLITSTLSSKLAVVDAEGTYFNPLRQMVESVFTEYNYINHYLLFKNKVKNATPYGFEPDPSNEFPLYSFLFDNDYHVSRPPYVVP